MKYKEIITNMTLEEKASMMSGKDFWQSRDIERLHIPSMFLADGPHGIRKQAEAADHLGLNASIPATCYPTAATIANSWSLELGEKIGRSLGAEAVTQKVNVLLGPGMNIKRNPLCGRNFEYFSEDPYLTGKMAAAYIKGIQSNGISACAKHFCANNQEKNRMTIDTLIDERTLREIYLTAFEIAVKEGKTKTLMSSYNKLNGTHTNENQHVMQKTLRDEWEFDGCVVTDWGGSNDRIEGMKAGNELEMPTTGGETDREIIKAVTEGRLDEQILDNNVDRILDLIFTTEKAFENNPSPVAIKKHHAVAQKAAEESIVLLKNDDEILPLSPEKTVAIIGDFARTARYQGAGSSIVNPTELNNIIENLDDSGLKTIGFEQGFHRYGKKSSSLKRKACALAEKADVIVLFLGLDEVTEAEGLDRPNLSLPRNQIHLLESIHKINREIIVVLSCGSVVEMPWINKVKGLVHTYLSGQAGSKAILNILSGKVNPSGKLAETYPLTYRDTPSYNNFPGEEVTVEYREGLFVGYRHFDTAEVPVLFPFGFGLSYTQFTYSSLEITETNVSFELANTGKQAGMEVAQLYIACESDTIFRPRKELKGFEKVFLKPGESKKITILFDDKSFRYFNVKTDKWEVEESLYNIMIGASSLDIKLSGQIQINGTDAPLPYEKSALPSYFSGKSNNVSLKEFETLLGRKVPDSQWDRTKPLSYNDTIAQCQYAKGGFARFAYGLINVVYKILWILGKRETANLIIMSVYNMPFRGVSRMTGGMVNMPMVDGLLIMVNGHFFKGLAKLLKERKKLISEKED